MSKYKTSPKSERTADGITFDSKLEMNRYLFLKELEKRKVIRDLVLQPRFKYHVTYEPEDPELSTEYHKTESYYADFRYTTNKGIEIIEDVKGHRTPTYKRKKQIVEALFGVTITEITRASKSL